ncbi:uncharacterized [Tachysurus ichikawai]
MAMERLARREVGQENVTWQTARHDSLDKIILELSSSTQAKRNSRRQAGRSGAEGGGRKPSIHPETQSVQHRQL